MKKSELTSLIQEEIQKIIKEEEPVNQNTLNSYINSYFKDFKSNWENLNIFLRKAYKQTKDQKYLDAGRRLTRIKREIDQIEL